MKIKASHLALATSLTFALTAAPAFAQASSDDDADTTAGESRDDESTDKRILVTAAGLKELDFIGGQDAIGREEIQRDLDGQIG